MDFYQSIAAYYDFIFSGYREQADFIKKNIYKPKQSSLLEIGCATGNLCLQLINLYTTITGIDSDKLMLETARKKQKTRQQKKVNFVNLNMLDIQNEFEQNSFNVIVCLGNTLAHLKELNQIENFLHQTKLILKERGTLLLQIINYDYILNNNITELPLIENSQIKFLRFYQYLRNRNLIDFETLLTIKKENRTIKNKISLYPLTKKKLNDLLIKSGYKKIKFYGDFDGNKLLKNSLPLIIKAG